MSTSDISFGRHRMDRSLDEIAAEMNSDDPTTRLPFGEEYEERDYVGAPIRGMSSTVKRHAPYSTGKMSSQTSLRRHDRGTTGSCRIFVANLSFATTQLAFKEHMRKAGTVVKCDIFRDFSGMSRGMGLVVYEDEETAETALRKLANTELDTRKLFLRKDLTHDEREKAGMGNYHGRGKPLPNPSATVFVGNLDYGVTWQKLKDIFKVAGRIVNADILTDREGHSKGLGEVQFEDSSEAIGAIALFHGQMLSDRPMTVRMDSKAPFQPDPLQLKLSSLGAVPNMITGISDPSSMLIGRSLSQRGGDYGYDPRGLPIVTQQPLRDVHRTTSDIFSRRSSRNDYGDSRRSYQSTFNRGLGDMLSRPVSNIGLESVSDFRGGSSMAFSRDRRARESDHQPVGNGSGGEGNKRLFVKNLNYSTTWQHLKDVFRGAGSVQHVDIMEGADGRSKGCGVVWFDSPESARKAIDMFNDYEVDGRRLEVRYDRLG